MTPKDVLTLLDYHYWARDLVLDALESLSDEQYTRDLGNSFKSIRDTVVHTYSAEWIWYQRWTGTSPTALLDPNTFPDRASLRRAWAENEGKVRELVGGMDQQGLDRAVDYTLVNGQASRSVFWHMLQHVVNHATYHRGQVTTMLRQLGAPAPPAQDLIRFYRERN
ncbi:MAG TPA: DinB family protein [Vicinamibacterales bacterium]|nr:DinB family protein [Vicinamibacterales bacterium]